MRACTCFGNLHRTLFTVLIFLLQTSWPCSSQFCLAGRTTEKGESSDVLLFVSVNQVSGTLGEWMNFVISWAAVFAVPAAGNPR